MNLPEPGSHRSRPHYWSSTSGPILRATLDANAELIEDTALLSIAKGVQDAFDLWYKVLVGRTEKEENEASS